MKRGWLIILTVVLILALLGMVCLGVGFTTGAETSRILTVLDNRYHVTLYYEYLTGQLFPALQQAGIF